MGSGIAIAFRSPAAWERLRPYARALALLFTAALPIHLALGGHIDRYHPLAQSVGYTVLAICFGAVLAVSVTPAWSTLPQRIFESFALRLLGKYSYAIYIVHLPVIIALQHHVLSVEQLSLRVGSTFLAKMIFVFVTLATSLLLALVSWEILEKRFLALRRLYK